MGGDELINTRLSNKRARYVYGGVAKKPRAHYIAHGNGSSLLIGAKIKDDADEIYESILKEKRPKLKASSDEVDAFIQRIKTIPGGKSGRGSEADSGAYDDDDDTLGVGEGGEEMMSVLQSDAVLVSKTQAKYAQKNFKPEVYTKRQLLEKMRSYYELIPKLLAGNIESYFYGLGSQLQRDSKHQTIQSWEFRSLPFHLFQCGYLGKKRAMLIKQKVALKYDSLFKRYHKNKVVEYFGIDNFITFIVLPEIVSYFIKDEFKLSSIDKAIDLMELTTDYGLYIMDKIDAEEEQYDSDLEDDEDMKSARGKLSLVDDQTNFVEDLMGFNDSDSSV